MINATSAAIASKNQLDKMVGDLQNSLEKVISAAIAQGSCQASFYPRNKFECEKAVEILTEHGYSNALHPAKDQRDVDMIRIIWG